MIGKDCPSKHRSPEVLMLAEAKELGCMCMRRGRVQVRRRILPRRGKLSFWQLMPRCGSNVVEILITVILVVFTADVGILLSGSVSSGRKVKDRSSIRGRGEVVKPEWMPVGP